MISNQILQNTIDGLKGIARVDFCVLDTEGKELAAAIDRFLRGLGEEGRNIFVRRYFYLDSVREIADRFRVSESKVKSQLFRLRNRLREQLEKEGIEL